MSRKGSAVRRCGALRQLGEFLHDRANACDAIIILFPIAAADELVIWLQFGLRSAALNEADQSLGVVKLVVTKAHGDTFWTSIDLSDSGCPAEPLDFHDIEKTGDFSR